MVKIQSHRHKIKAFYMLFVSINQSKPKGNRHNTGKSADNSKNRTTLEHFVKSTKNQPQKSEKAKMKMSYKLCNMHRKIFCVNFQIVKNFIFSSFSYSFRLISAWPVHFFSSVPRSISFSCYNNLLKFPYDHPAFILSFIL